MNLPTFKRGFNENGCYMIDEKKLSEAIEAVNNSEEIKPLANAADKKHACSNEILKLIPEEQWEEALALLDEYSREAVSLEEIRKKTVQAIKPFLHD